MKRSNFDFLIVGTNFISDNFTDAVRRLDGVGISAVLSRRKEIGPIRSARFEFTQYSSRYDRFLAGERVNTFDRTLGNAALLDLGVYAISCALMIFGEPQGEIVSRSAFLDCGFEASGNALLSYPGERTNSGTF